MSEGYKLGGRWATLEALIISTFVGLCSFPGLSVGQPNTAQLISPHEEAAQKGLATLKAPQFFGQGKADTIEQYARDLGFEKSADVIDAQLGSAFEVKRIGLDQLKNFKSGGNLDDLLHQSPSMFIYPITVKGVVLSSLTVSEYGEKGAWRWTQRGAPLLIRKLEKYRKESGASLVVWIEGLNLRFLVVDSGNSPMLIPISDLNFDKIQIKAGEKMPAAKVLGALTVLAARVPAKKGLR